MAKRASGSPRGARGRVVPAWAEVLLLVGAVVLVPWAVLLLIELPDRRVARHWDVAWAGLDVAIAAALAATVATVWRRSVWVPAAATAAATLLVVDAWFDVVTAASAGQRWTAIGMAALGELPLAGVCALVAGNVERVLEQMRRYAVAAGYHVDGGDLGPEDRDTDATSDAAPPGAVRPPSGAPAPGAEAGPATAPARSAGSPGAARPDG